MMHNAGVIIIHIWFVYHDCHSFELLGICIYGSAALLCCDLKPDARGFEVYEVVTESWGIAMNLQILTHRGKLVNPALSLVQQGYVHGSTVFATIRATDSLAIMAQTSFEEKS